MSNQWLRTIILLGILTGWLAAIAALLLSGLPIPAELWLIPTGAWGTLKLVPSKKEDTDE